jgi:DNA/RNA endonuclease G (NUC1)
MMLLARVLLAMLLVAAYLSPAAAEIIRLDYEGFTIWLDCERRGAVKFRYNAQRDQGDLERPSTFRMDPDAPERCQQTFTHAYSHPDPKYHRGHLVPANHLDHSETAMRQSNFMTNILPQTQALNLGAWKRTEAITECYRDIDELLVIGGVIWGDDAADDHFTQSHGVAGRVPAGCGYCSGTSPKPSASSDSAGHQPSKSVFLPSSVPADLLLSAQSHPAPRSQPLSCFRSSVPGATAAPGTTGPP